MKNLLFPDIYVESLLDIPLETLWNLDIRGFILDLDNTVTEWNNRQVRPEIVEWMQRIRQRGFKACISSNNGRERVVSVADSLGIPFVSKAGKPRRRAFVRALEVIDCPRSAAAVVGDQIFTDILGGNRMAMMTILVKPIDRREFIGTRIMRQVEKLVLVGIGRAVERGEINRSLRD